MIPKNIDSLSDECDFFDTNRKDTPPPPSSRIKYIALGVGVFFIIGGGYYFFKSSSSLKNTPLIMIYPIDHPLKIKPDLKITEDTTKQKPQNVIYDKIIKKKKHVEKKQKNTYEEPAITTSTESSYYICLGTFETHYDASVKWQQIKGDRFEDLKDVEPIIRVIATNDGKGYQLLAGPLGKASGIKLANEFKTSLLSVDN